MKKVHSFFCTIWNLFSRFWDGKARKFHAKDKFGEKGENRATQFLKLRGYQILTRNVRFSKGEIDIVAKNENSIVFIEVKTRHSAEYCHPIEAVDKKKQKKIKQMGLRYYREKKYAGQGFAIRFDIVTLIWPDGEEPVIEHFVDAFR